MFREISNDALKLALKALTDPVAVSHVETFLKAAKPIVIEMLEKEIAERTAETAAQPAPKPALTPVKN